MSDERVRHELDQLKAGIIDLYTEEDLVKKMTRFHREGKPMVVKAGFDPTSSDIHLGHTVLMNKMRQFQDMGHRVAYVVGDATAMIGDPTGRNKTRKVLTRDEILEHAKTYATQAFKILDPQKTEMVFNSTWLFKLDFIKLIDLTSKYNVARMLEREDFKNRFKSGDSISVHEFLYPLAQGYDSVALKSDVELGGTDQIFNLLVGRKLQADYGQEPQVVMTVPLLVGLDGTQKMSKSYGNYIGVTEPADSMFAKVMSISDDLMWSYYELLTTVPVEDIAAMKNGIANDTVHPRDCKVNLALFITARFHGEPAAREAKENFYREIPSNLAEYSVTLPDGGLALLDLIANLAFVESKSDARRMIQQGGVYIDANKVSDVALKITSKDSFVLKVGKKKIGRVNFN
ncbi:MAG TPA: tyrosine--tRNA ligase [bacterium]|nr:tyrosine--tRNA ligase [bacterium]